MGFGCLSGLYVISLGLWIATLFWHLRGDLFIGGLPINWSFVPAHAVVPLWIADRCFGWSLIVAFVAGLLAPAGFFRRARGRGGRALLLSYALPTLLICITFVGALVYLMCLGWIGFGRGAVRYSPSDVLSAGIVAAVPLTTAVAALFAARRSRV